MNSAHHLPCHPSTKHTHLPGYTWYLSAVKLSLAVQFVIQWIIMANWNIDWKHPGSNFPNIHTLCHLLRHPSRHQLPSFHDFYRLLTPPIIIVALCMSWRSAPRDSAEIDFEFELANFLFLHKDRETPCRYHCWSRVSTRSNCTATQSVTAAVE